MTGLRRYIRPYYGYILLTMLIKFFGALVELLIPYLLETILDDVVPTGSRSGILLTGGAMVLCALLCVSSNIVANRMSAKSAGNITLALRHDLFQRLDTLSARQLDRLTLPSAVSRLTSDTYNVNQLLARMQRLGVRGPILLLGGVCITLYMDAGLAMVLIATLPLIGVLVYFVTKTSVPLYTKEQGVLDRMVRVVQENITGIRVIKALSKTEYETRRFGEVNGNLCAVDRKVGGITALTNPTATLILNLGLTGVVLLGAYRVNGGLTQPGVIIAFLNYFTMILNAMLGVTQIFIIWSKGEASAKRVVEVLNLPQDLAVETGGERATGYLEFRDVSFSYNHVSDNLSHLSFTLERGQTLGILGATGSGKTTLVNLLLRFYDPDQGAIFLDGRNLKSYTPEELRPKFGVVFQNDFIMEGTLAGNIQFCRKLPPESLDQAARIAQADFIFRKGMDHPVAVRGNNLSGGQKQRLAIARALAGKPELLVLDDASSALDYRTDAALRQALRRDMAGVTQIIVAQRISSLRHADLILVLEEGRVIGRGNHSSLLRTCPAYRQIAETQMGAEGGGDVRRTGPAYTRQGFAAAGARSGKCRPVSGERFCFAFGAIWGGTGFCWRWLYFSALVPARCLWWAPAWRGKPSMQSQPEQAGLISTWC